MYLRSDGVVTSVDIALAALRIVYRAEPRARAPQGSVVPERTLAYHHHLPVPGEVLLLRQHPAHRHLTAVILALLQVFATQIVVQAVAASHRRALVTFQTVTAAGSEHKQSR